MQTDGRTQSYGRRETTLIGYPPAPNTPRPQLPGQDIQQDVAPPAPQARTAEPVTAPANESAENLVANLAGTLEPAVEPMPAPVTPPIVLAEVRPIAPVDRRNPLSRRLPINRGRHLSRAFFEEGERHEEAGWEHSPLATDSSFGVSSTQLGFSSFDRVPRKRAPMIALAAAVGMAAAILGAWALGWWSPRGAAPTDVWTVLRVPGAGWQPPATTTTTAPPVVAAAHNGPTPAPTPAPTPRAFAPTGDGITPTTMAPAAATPALAKAPAKPRPQPSRVVAPAPRKHAVVARRVQPRAPLARTAPPARVRAKAPSVPAANAASANDSVNDGAADDSPAPTRTVALPPASTAPEAPQAASAPREAPAAEAEPAPADAQ